MGSAFCQSGDELGGHLLRVHDRAERSASKVWRKQPGCSMNGASVSKVLSTTCAWRLASYPRTESAQSSRSFPLCRVFLLLPWRLPSAHLLDPHATRPMDTASTSTTGRMDLGPSPPSSLPRSRVCPRCLLLFQFRCWVSPGSFHQSIIAGSGHVAEVR